MSVLKDAELRAIQLDVFTPESSPERKYRQPQYYTIHQMDRVKASLNPSRGAHYLLMTDGELCFPINYHPTKVSAAGDVFFNAAGEVAGISNDSEHYNSGFHSVFPVLWLLRHHGFAFASQVELLQEDRLNPNTTFVSKHDVFAMLDKLPEELTDELRSANSGNQAPSEEIIEDYAFLDEFKPEAPLSRYSLWQSQEVAEDEHMEMAHHIDSPFHG